MSLIALPKPVYISSGATVVGKKEYEGPIGADFDMHDDTEKFGMDTWEKAESEMQRRAMALALKKANLKEDGLDALFAGDLQNQCTASAFGLLEYDAPYFGLYGACSTFAEAITLGSLMTGAGYFSKVGCVASSHFCTAERQFRFPLEYGGQRTPTSQRTATAAGAVILSSEKSGSVKIRSVYPGRIVDLGITDINNMGGAMAPAALDTLLGYFEASGKKPEDFDAVLTGDLGKEGHGILLDLLSKNGIHAAGVYNDCGLLLYNLHGQDMHAGGSGCGCSASVITGHILKRMEKGELKNVLYVATGALMNPASVFQGLSIPGIAHLVHLETEGN